MAFLDALRQRNRILPAGSTFGNEMYYGQPPIDTTGGADIGSLMNESIINQNRMRNRENADFAFRTGIAGNEGIRQENYRRLFDPNSGAMTTLRPQNTVYQPSIAELTQVTPFQRESLGVEREKIKQQGRTADAALALREGEFGLDKLKNEQIFATKMADMERKASEANQRLQIATDRLQSDQNNASARKDFQDAQIAATNARMELLREQHAAQLAETTRLNDARIAEMQAKLDQSANQVTKTELSPEGTERTVTTQRGTPKQGETIRVIETATGRHGSWPAGKPLPKGYVKIGK